MDVLVDTNVLLRLVNELDSRSPAAVLAHEKLLRQRHKLFVAPQNLIEFWTVCTRPLRANGMGLTVDATHRLLEITENGFLRLEDTDLVYRRWREPVIGYSISGRQVQDAHLVASMLVHDVTHILTFNGRDFVRYAKIEVIDPLTMA